MKKNVIVYSGFCGVNKRAVEILTHTIFDYAHEVPDCISSESVSFDDNTRYFFIGTKKGLETKLVPNAGYDIHFGEIDTELLMIATIQSAQGITDLLERIFYESIF